MINPHSTIQTIRRHMTLYRNALAASGKPDPEELPVIKEVFCAKGRKQHWRWRPLSCGKISGLCQVGSGQGDAGKETFDQEFESLITDRFIVGSPESCYEQLRPYWEEFGVNHL
ncbi:MAG: hypothetical protein Ct9H300mP16_19140 [Pseudomonadota bacterium]|nr:MAG: hypothetical protein Ct9H300mP16_19140 [Pseudomonadota bacterium]